MNTWWYMHTVTLYQLSCTRTRDDIYIPQLYINFLADDHLMIYRYRNLKKNFSADKHVVIYTCYNFILTFLQMNTWWYIHTATLYQLCCRLKPDDIYIPKLYINFRAVVHVMIYTYGNFIFPADKHVMIYTYRNFISTFLQMNTWWYMHTATLHQLSCSWTPDDIYIPQLYINFPADEHVMIYIYIPQLYINFPADEHVMIYTNRNFISTFLDMNTWWYIHTATLYQLFCRWKPDDMYIPKLNINFPAVVLVIIYTYRNFISIF